MPVDGFMYFGKSSTGAVIEGESSDKYAIDETGAKLKPFEIISFEWGAYIGKKDKHKTNTTGQPTPPGKGSSSTGPPTSSTSETTSHREVTVDHFKVSKPFDSASCGLFTATTNPTCVFDKAVVLFRKSGGGDPFIYLKFIFKKVQVDSVEWKIESAEGGDKPDQEDVKFSFQECEIFYSPQGTKGEKLASFGTDQKKTASYKRAQADADDDSD